MGRRSSAKSNKNSQRKNTKPVPKNNSSVPNVSQPQSNSAMGNIMGGITSGIGLRIVLEAVRGVGNAISGSNSKNEEPQKKKNVQPQQIHNQHKDICSIFSEKFTECMSKNQSGEDCILYLNNYNLCKQNMF